MNRLGRGTFSLILLGMLVGASVNRGQTPDPNAGGSVASILDELDRLVPPNGPVNRENRESISEYTATRDQIHRRRAELIWKLYQTDPRHPRIAGLMAERWKNVQPYGSEADALVIELDQVIGGTPNPALRTEALYMKAIHALRRVETRLDPALPAVEAFLQAAPGDERSGQLLYTLGGMAENEKQQTEFEDRLIREYPQNRYARAIQGARRRKSAVGKPFEMPEFTDLLTGRTYSMASWPGKVVVVAFWGTWSRPSVESLLSLRKLSTKYGPGGVEFVGVCLDRPNTADGRKAAEAFLRDRDIAWPQFYLADGWENDFPIGWGVDTVPFLYVIDRMGNVHSTPLPDQLKGTLEELTREEPRATDP